MKRIILILLFIISLGSIANAANYDISPPIRFTLDREESISPLVYYFSPPHTAQDYPILVLCEGSSSKGNLHSVLFIRDYFAQRIQSLQVGYLTIEKWGIDGKHINESEFWSHYTRSQRLEDHLKVIEHLEKHPPVGWNGQLIFIGISEGGPLVTDLSTIYPRTLATINWVGAGIWPWEKQVWQFFESWKQNSFWMRLYDVIPRWLPFSSDIPQTQQEFDALVEHIISNPTVNQWMGGMTYLYHADALLKPPVDYGKIQSPFLVVKGTLESDIESCDQFVQRCMKAGVPITYFRIKGMGHWLRKRPDVIDQSFDWLKQQISQKKD